jgi:microcystin degradation protein MlrC
MDYSAINNGANSTFSLHREGASTATAFLRRLVEKAIGDRSESPQQQSATVQATFVGGEAADLEINCGGGVGHHREMVHVFPVAESLGASRSSLMSALNQAS